MIGFGVVVLAIGPRADVARVERDIGLTRTRIEPERHVDALDFLEAVALCEAVRKELLAAVVVLERRDRRVLVELERDDEIGFEHIVQLAGNHGVVAAIGTARDGRNLVDEQLRAARRAVERAELLLVEVLPMRIAQVGVDRVFARNGGHSRGRCRGRPAAIAFARPSLNRMFGPLLLRCFLIGGILPLGVELLDFLRREIGTAEIAFEPSRFVIEAKPPLTVRTLIRSCLGHIAPPMS